MLKYFLGVIIRESFLGKDEEKFTKLSKNLNITYKFFVKKLCFNNNQCHHFGFPTKNY